jgi:NADPH:quinone reductase-like Zn-dependent oxidoreductase
MSWFAGRTEKIMFELGWQRWPSTTAHQQVAAAERWWRTALSPATRAWVQLALVLALVALALVVLVTLVRWAVVRWRRTQLKGRVVLVTGGANGLGRHLVQQLHALGAVIVVWDIDAEGLRSVGTISLSCRCLTPEAYEY